jgi:cytochrome c
LIWRNAVRMSRALNALRWRMARRFQMVRGLVWGLIVVIAGLAAAPAARAADARRGESLAQSHSASCHIVAPHARNEVADAPPFEVIGRKYGFDAGMIAHAITGPHRKMNFMPDPEEAADIAAYIATLGY